MKILVLAMASVFLLGCQTQAVKSDVAIVDFHKVEQTRVVPALDESMATLDMAEFARRH